MPTVLFKLTPSRYFLWLIFILYSLLLISLSFSEYSHHSHSNSILILFILTGWINFYGIDNAQQRFKLLAFHHKSGWKIVDKDSQAYHINLKRNSFCSRFLIILNFIVENSNQKISLVILPDSMIKQDFKCLRRYLLNKLGEVV